MISIASRDTAAVLSIAVSRGRYFRYRPSL